MANLQLALKAPSHDHPLPSPLTSEAIPTLLPVMYLLPSPLPSAPPPPPYAADTETVTFLNASLHCAHFSFVFNEGERAQVREESTLEEASCSGREERGREIPNR